MPLFSLAALSLLQAFCKRLRLKQICDGRVEQILSARVPIIKFTESRSGDHLHCPPIDFRTNQQAVMAHSQTSRL